MYKKLFIIVFLAFILSLFLYFKPFKEPVHKEFEIEYILPEAQIIGKAYLLDFLKETSDLLIFNDVPYRKFLTYEFILGVAKKYGIDLQSASYFFSNGSDELGFVIPLFKDSKLNDIIEIIDGDYSVSDTLIQNKKIYQIRAHDIYFYKEKRYAIFYKGSNFEKIFRQINSERKTLRDSWDRLFKNPYFKNEHLVMYCRIPELLDLGMDHMFLAHDSDSSEFYLKSRVVMNDSIPFLLKSGGKGMQYSENSTRIIDLHLNFSYLNRNTKEKISKKLEKMAGKIGFPMNDFIDLWAGDLCFEEGGYYRVNQTYIETELDENFETLEVEKTREVIVPRYKLMFSTLYYGGKFINRLIQKGIITAEENQFRFLYSPLFNMSIYKDAVVFYSSERPPRMTEQIKNRLIWDYKGSQLYFDIDSSLNNTLFGGVHIPASAMFSIP